MGVGRALVTAAAAFAFGLAAPLAAAKAQEIKISHQWRQNADARDLATRRFVEAVNKRDASLKFRIYPNRSLIADPVAQMDAMQNGSLEMAVYPLSYGTGKVPEFSITIMPGTFASLDGAVRAKGTPFYNKLQQVAEKNGLHIVTWWWTPGGFASRTRQIGGPATVKGLSMRAADPTFELMLKEAGASVQNLPSTEIYPALQSGVLDSALTSAESFVSLRLYELTKYATIGGDYTLWLLLQPLVMSKAAWDKLTPAQKKTFDEAAKESEAFFNGGQHEVVAKMIETYKKAGNEVRPLSKADYDAWVELAKRTSWPAYGQLSPDAKELLDLVQKAN
jgi:TRAP-type C4-dicarboxylate transport system substrate-binding protein